MWIFGISRIKKWVVDCTSLGKQRHCLRAFCTAPGLLFEHRNGIRHLWFRPKKQLFGAPSTIGNSRAQLHALHAWVARFFVTQVCRHDAHLVFCSIGQPAAGSLRDAKPSTAVLFPTTGNKLRRSLFCRAWLCKWLESGSLAFVYCVCVRAWLSYLWGCTSVDVDLVCLKVSHQLTWKAMQVCL